MKILLVDDNANDRKIVRHNLEKRGEQTVVEACNGKEGIELARSEKPDLIISDAMMPVMDGFQFLRSIKSDEELSNIPFIFYSAVYTGHKEEELALSLGAEAFLVKPLEPKIFWSEVREILDSRKDKEDTREETRLTQDNGVFLSKYSVIVAAKLEDKVRELEETLIQCKKTEDALKASEERYRGLLESVTDYIYTVTVKDNLPVASSHSPGCLSVTGFTPEEFAAEPMLWYHMVHLEDRPAVLEQVSGMLSGKIVPLEHRIVHKDGGVRWVRNTPVMRNGEQGQIMAYDGLISDITERRKLENQLLHSQKMEALGTLVGGIAHDFNNILMVIIGYVNILKNEMIKDNRPVSYLEEVLTASERACALTKSLLAFGRKQEMTAKASNINVIVSGVEKMLRRLLREDIELHFILSEEELVIMADQLQIEQILFNLAINARDAMPSGGTISISIGTILIDQEFRNLNGFGEPGKYSLLTFSDNGTGMDEQTRQRIFEPFFTTKDLGRGTGLGLSMCHGIVAQHKGYIECQSTPGSGTTFKIYLPLISDRVEINQHVAKVPLPGGTELILLAEDDQQLRALFGKMLAKQGYSVIEAMDGEDALNKFIEHGNDIHLVIVDCIMPKMNGKEVCREIAKLNPQMRFIFTSGYTADIFDDNDFEEFKIHFLSKPVKQNELLQCVRCALNGNQ